MSMVRISGAAAALASAALLAWVAYLSFGPESLVVPNVDYRPAAGGQNPAAQPGAAAEKMLGRRTELQSESYVANGGKSLDASSQGERLAPRQGVGNAVGIVDGWLGQGPKPGDGGKLLQEPRFRSGATSLPYREAEVFVQPQGRDFRRLRNDQVRYGGGWLIFGVTLALALFLAGRGRVRTLEGESGQSILRFNATERAVHWMTAIAFLIMALTGLVVLYGKSLLQPWMGDAAFSTLAGWSAWTHMSSAVPFVLGVVLMAIMWVRGNLLNRLDWRWLKSGGGFLRDDGNNPPAARFNAGQKLVFWGVVLGGLAMLVTGLVLMFPFYWTGYTGMQAAQLLHAAIGLLMIAMIIGHIYIGSVGMVGAFQAMWSGLVDRTWAKEHHSIWYEAQTGEHVSREERRGPQAGE